MRSVATVKLPRREESSLVVVMSFRKQLCVRPEILNGSYNVIPEKSCGCHFFWKTVMQQALRNNIVKEAVAVASSAVYAFRKAATPFVHVVHVFERHQKPLILRSLGSGHETIASCREMLCNSLCSTCRVL